MLTVEFMKKLEDRYPNMTTELGQDISRLIETLDGPRRDMLWAAFIDNYDYNTPPRRATFTKLLMKEGLYSKPTNTKFYVGHCKDCNVFFPYNVRECPLCGKDFIMLATEEIPSNLIKMHDSCASCNRFIPYETTGARCELWGLHQSDWHLNGSSYTMQIERCKKCECRICCREELIFRTNYDLYKEMLARGDFKDGHINRRK